MDVLARIWTFLSTLPAWGATTRTSQGRATPANFYPRSPRGERLQPGSERSLCTVDFYPRSPRGERPQSIPGCPSSRDFYPRSPRGERRFPAPPLSPDLQISIHAPRVGSDPPRYQFSSALEEFLSTLPAWGATTPFRFILNSLIISIHAPRVGSDGSVNEEEFADLEFLSTLPAWGATSWCATS